MRGTLRTLVRDCQSRWEHWLNFVLIRGVAWAVGEEYNGNVANYRVWRYPRWKLRRGWCGGSLSFSTVGRN
ncbi:hypothetical protein GE061_012132 [Apolygus lucorum]|uniref:Uncharacterized protein n=1 Tax=Apolygus lucorum TaxID=248454 RepID=A0A6A4JXL0_APOLU|nr:hypothetical protein GE061_012132 [Apolygus lucorum]